MGINKILNKLLCYSIQSIPQINPMKKITITSYFIFTMAVYSSKDQAWSEIGSYTPPCITP